MREDGRLSLVLPLEESGELPLLARWVLLTLEHTRLSRPRRGPLLGLGLVPLRRRYEGSVLAWCERDAGFEGPTRRMRLDCLECGACCRDADLHLEESDLQRWRDAARPELQAKVLRTQEGKLRLPMISEGRCPQLGPDLRCGIYALRPDNCRAFPVASEACLSARLETLGLLDGQVRSEPC